MPHVKQTLNLIYFDWVCPKTNSMSLGAPIGAHRLQEWGWERWMFLSSILVAPNVTKKNKKKFFNHFIFKTTFVSITDFKDIGFLKDCQSPQLIYWKQNPYLEGTKNVNHSDLQFFFRPLRATPCPLTSACKLFVSSVRLDSETLNCFLSVYHALVGLDLVSIVKACF